MTLVASTLQRLKAVRPHTWWFVGLCMFVVVFDQVSKYYAVAHLTRAFEAAGGEPLGFAERLDRFCWTEHPVRSEPVAVLDNFWHFRYAENPGAAWSFLAGAPQWFRTPFLLLISVAAMVFIVVYYRRTTEAQRLLRVALALVFGGAVGNFFDRVRLGYVIDFIDWHWYDKATWPTFNVADSAISVGVALMILEMLWHKLRAARGAARALGD
ncbi:MAG: signal peptidase II [Deltaproteobacteria bacterium]|nr:signal peptidase II [Deltaproteobacteria bacterium]